MSTARLSARVDYPAIATGYIALWNEPDLDRTRTLAVFADEARYVDPNVEASGADEICRYIALTRRHFAGATFMITGAVDGHHAGVTFRWSAERAGRVVASGVDFAELDGQRIRVLHGFFDR